MISNYGRVAGPVDLKPLESNVASSYAIRDGVNTFEGKLYVTETGSVVFVTDEAKKNTEEQSVYAGPKENVGINE